MNPPSHLGSVEGTADERSLVYVTGNPEKPQAIIFISFDLAIKLANIQQWPGYDRCCATKYVHIEGRGGPGVISKDVEGMFDFGGIEDGVPDISMSHEWIWTERAMYRDINLGFHFGLSRGF